MKNKKRELLYLILFVFLCELILFSIILLLPDLIVSFLFLLFLAFLVIIFFIRFKKNYMKKNSQKIAKNYPCEKEAVDTMIDVIYDSLSEDTKNSLALMVNCNEDYIVDFIYNLKKFAKYSGVDIDELTKYQRGACLIYTLYSSTEWVFQSPNEDADSIYKLITINLELAIQAGLLLCGFTLEVIENNLIYTSDIGILLLESREHRFFGSTMLMIILIADFLAAF